MLMVMDVGNTNIVGGMFSGGTLGNTFRIHTDPRKTEDEYGTLVRAILRDKGMDLSMVDKTVVSSVVPSLTMSVVKMVTQLTGKKPILVGPDMYGKLPLKIVNAREIGTDLVANALAAWTGKKGPCIIVDFGTALTFTSVTRNGEIAGVSIVPGINTAVSSLSRETAQLPYVELVDPGTIMGFNTVTAIQSGIVYGYTGLVEYLVGKLKLELGDDTSVVATGGLHRVIAPHTDVFDVIDPDLTLKGLAGISGYC